MVCSNGHGGGKRGCYGCTWAFSNITVLQSILLCCIVLQVKIIVNTCES
jgi:hypothetical protein